MMSVRRHICNKYIKLYQSSICNATSQLRQCTVECSVIVVNVEVKRIAHCPIAAQDRKTRAF